MRFLLAFVMVLCLSSFVLQAADTPVTGTWAWTATPEDGDTVQGSLEIKDDGGAIAGTLITGEGERIEIVNPKLEGDQFSFTVTVGENTYNVAVTVSGDKFSGKFKGDAASGTIEGKKKV